MQFEFGVVFDTQWSHYLSIRKNEREDRGDKDNMDYLMHNSPHEIYIKM